MAAELKEKGNKEFAQGNYAAAVEHFTKAIELDGNDHVFYSNRSACYSSLHEYDKALEDANKCIQLKPDWVRGYTRKGLAQFYLEDYEEAIETYETGLKLDPNNQQLKEGLEQAQHKLKESGASAGNPMAGLFSEENIQKLRSHPKTAHFFLQQDFNTMLQLVKMNPNMMSMMFQDPRFSECLSVLLGFDLSGMPKPPARPQEHEHKEEPRSEPKPQPEHKEAKVEEVKSEPSAESYKELGNTAYRNKEWARALEFYDKALELNPEEVTYINNKAAVYFGMKDYQKCIEVCDEAAAKAKEVRSELSKLARAYSRKGLALQQLGDLDGAIAAIKASLMECKDDKLKFTLRDIEKLKKKRDEELYINPEKAEESNAVANERFKEGNFPAAIAAYDEAIKRSPKCAKYYSNRSACYIKLLEYPTALRDADKALELEPNFIRALIRKASIHSGMKEYHKALDAYQKVLGLEPDNSEAQEGYQRVMMSINSSSNQPDDERIRHAMADPEIQGILRDPTIQQVLKDLQEKPNESQSYLKDPKIMAAISKLAAAGILRLG